MASAALLAGLAACGSGAPTRAAFLPKADAVCRADSGVLGAIARPGDFAAVADASSKLATTAGAEVAKLRKLPLPSADKVTVQAVWDGLGATAASAKALADAATIKAGAQAGKAAADVGTQAKATDDKARAYGFTECGRLLQVAAATVADGAKPVVKQDYITKLDALCRTANDETNKVPDPRNLAEVATGIDRTLAIAKRTDADMKAVAVPPGDEATMAELFSMEDRLTAQAEAVKAAAQRRDGRATLSALSDLDALSTQADAKADAYGFKDCGTGGS
jgi:hypothetical protein